MSEAVPLLTPEQYLAMERASRERHEYVHGQIHLLAGARLGHNKVAANLQGMLWQHLKDRPCLVFGSDTKLRPAGDVFYYPDLMVSCAPAADAADFVADAKYVFEVTSESTKRIDRGEKAAVYFGLASIEAYILLEQQAMQVIVLRRGTSDWETEILAQPTDRLRLDGIGFECALAEIYARTDLV